MSDWDFERQKSETEDTIRDLEENQNVPVGPEARVTLDVFLMPGNDADEDALERALAMFGYAGDPSETEDKEPVYVVSIPDVALTAEVTGGRSRSASYARLCGHRTTRSPRAEVRLLQTESRRRR